MTKETTSALSKQDVEIPAGHKYTKAEIREVQSVIEKGLTLYKSKMEIFAVLKKVDQNVVNLVWQKLEQNNPRFFTAYLLRLAVIKQIKVFQQLLVENENLKQKNGSQSPAQNSTVESHSNQQMSSPNPMMAQLNSMNPMSSNPVNMGSNASPNNEQFNPERFMRQQGNTNQPSMMMQNQFSPQMMRQFQMNPQFLPQFQQQMFMAMNNQNPNNQNPQQLPMSQFSNYNPYQQQMNMSPQQMNSFGGGNSGGNSIPQRQQQQQMQKQSSQMMNKSNPNMFSLSSSPPNPSNSNSNKQSNPSNVLDDGNFDNDNNEIDALLEDNFFE